ncbi:MAG: glycosyltransferase family 2 protein [Gemmataceae bacterium]
MEANPALSLIVPTRHRIAQVKRFLDSLAKTATHPEHFEVILVVDKDDPSSANLSHPVIQTRCVLVSPGRTMGQLNRAGAEAARGEFLMLLNDDVVARSPGWDIEVLGWLRRFRDGIVLVHVNDTLMREHLCTFPIVSRVYCEMAGGICPEHFQRYRIDDHIQDIFARLGDLGERRRVYLPRVVFEHLNGTQMPGGHLEYHADPEILSRDAPLFDQLQDERGRIARNLLKSICEKRGDWAPVRGSITRPFPVPVSSAEGPAQLRVEPFQPGLSRDSLSVVLLDGEISPGQIQERLDAIVRHAGEVETFVVNPGPTSLAEKLRSMACLTRSDYLLVLTNSAQPTGGILTSLLGAMNHRVGMVLPDRDAGIAPPGLLIDRNICFTLSSGPESGEAGWDYQVKDLIQRVISSGWEVIWVPGVYLRPRNIPWWCRIQGVFSPRTTTPSYNLPVKERANFGRDCQTDDRDQQSNLYWVGPPKPRGYWIRLWTCITQRGWRGIWSAAHHRLNHLFRLS